MKLRAIVTSAGAAVLLMTAAAAAASPADASAATFFRGPGAALACYHAGENGVKQGLWFDYDCENIPGGNGKPQPYLFYLITW